MIPRLLATRRIVRSIAPVSFGPHDLVTVRNSPWSLLSVRPYFWSFGLTSPCSGCAIEPLVAVLWSNALDELVARSLLSSPLFETTT
jgi:hypothetical protein